MTQEHSSTNSNAQNLKHQCSVIGCDLPDIIEQDRVSTDQALRKVSLPCIVSEQYILLQMQKALRAIDISPKRFGAKKIEESAHKLWKQTVSFFSARKRPLDQDFGYFNFPTKTVQNLEWLTEFGVRKDQWGKALIACPELFTHNPDQLRDKFVRNVNWLMHYQAVPYGIRTPEERTALQRKGAIQDWSLTLDKKHDAYFKGANSLQRHFELGLALTAHPNFRVHNVVKADHETRKNFLLHRRTVMLGTAEDNLVLRSLYLELTQNENPSGGALNYTRTVIEKNLMARLMPSLHQAIVPRRYNAQQIGDVGTIQARVTRFADSLVADIKANPIVDEPRTYPSLIAQLVPEGDALRTNSLRPLLAERLIHVGLIKSYNCMNPKS